MNVYCFDTSAFLEAWNHLYPLRRFPGFWSRLAGLVEATRIISPPAVRKELTKKDDEILKWCSEREEMFVSDTRPMLDGAKEIIRKNPRLMENKPGRNGADPFVISLAQQRTAVLVTEEKLSSNAQAPRIPNICAVERIQCVNVLGFLDAEQWTF